MGDLSCSGEFHRPFLLTILIAFVRFQYAG